MTLRWFGKYAGCVKGKNVVVLWCLSVLLVCLELLEVVSVVLLISR